MSTRQATPGPSNGTALQPQQLNSKKRAMSEGDGDGDNVTNQKRVKKDDNVAEVAFSHSGPLNKDKKKRKKKKRKLSVVLAAAIEPDMARARSKSRPRSATATVQPSTRASPFDTKPSSNVATPETVDTAAQTCAEGDASPPTPFSDKGKGKALPSLEESQSPIPSTSVEPPAVQIARLTKELEVQSLSLQKHQAQLTHIHQSLTCQICLDLLHKPFAMAPCGHIACHSCLVRWFTAPSGDGPVPRHAGELSHINKRKTCPICRTVVAERPVEVWGIKSMVGSIVRSGLIELVVPPPATGDDVPTQGPNGNPDPWRHIFRPANRSRHHFDFFGALPPVDADENAPRGNLAEMGMYDAEDGGIYRCIDCMNEIWDGSCTGCRRVYLGHQPADDADDAPSDEGEDDSVNRNVFGRTHGRQRMLRDFINMLSRGGPGAFDLDEDESDLEFGASGMFNDDDDDDDDEDEDEDEGHDDESDIVAAFDAMPAALPPPPAYPHHPFGFREFPDFIVEENESDSDEEAGIARIEDLEGYESSFVDDDDIGDVDMDLRRQARRSHRHGRRLNHTSRINPRDSGSGSDSIIASDGDGDDGGIAVEDVIRNIGRNVRLGTGGANRRGAPTRGGSRVIVIDSDESSSSDIEIVGGPTRGRRRQQRSGHDSLEHFDDSTGAEDAEEGSDDDEQVSYGEDGSVPGPASRLRRLMNEDED